jgi:hypothetical protein
MNGKEAVFQAIHDFLLLHPSTDNELQVVNILKHEIGLVKTIYFMYHLYLVNDLRIMAEAAQNTHQDDETELTKYIEDIHAELELASHFS